MSSIVVVGTQWGDEGKGKITDFLAEQADVIARFSGGNNAGHTIQFGGETYKLHLVPSGIFYKDKLAVIGNGVVVDPVALLKELDGLNERGVSTSNLRISNRAQVILPYHLAQDEYEERRRGDNKIGTTKKGIGPAYVDKAQRIGIRMADLLEKETFERRLKENIEVKNAYFKGMFNETCPRFDEIFDEYYAAGQRLKEFVTDTSKILDDAFVAEEKVLFEGAQGVMLDIDHGTYPFVTSSNPVAGNVTVGTGVGPTFVSKVIGVCKAYTSRVGDGPFPTELFDENGHHIREVGREYGTTTGRPRRVGWFDSVVLRHSRRVSGITDLSINSIDVLTGLDTVKICIAYELDGEEITEYPANLDQLRRCKPIFEELPGWEEDITGCRTLEELPDNARKYLERISELCNVRISIFSVGPDRDQTNLLEQLW
ncbi:adenylosuccinate synthase [Staphylococcus haemolyticus]|jgi:adenylosuccinate synthase|uniref:adenylosuccinate synthase n=1 Tax=Staphylococcus haemolyticus TaxID=1283 RepID=UPI00069D9FC7|nr:adenylosuccinate synthase [Staphylococcus haemolyticus]SIJ09984.1 adenylosuccinate synthetase [Mycobacteroides abscessus subsp. abscessus]MBC3014570.1 adenylosuccinate synthase [Staphylococcus haemolyticus]MBC3115780.1 adenylosuccinate synthase [Staphylococcus haemolyticus]MBC3125005.1 adenylosuccinate synthase [Staphylococcus haemolyticus]MCH4415609.1 adenylosuccinate synthase [Staphylococcus haemolyticus]